MKLTPKKLKVSANINMAYVINYLNKYLNYSYERAFNEFIATQCFFELADLRSGLCTAMSPDVLFLFEEDSNIELKEDDAKISGAFEIEPKLQYLVNMSEAFREEKRIKPEKYSEYISKHNIWHRLENEYEVLSAMKREEVINALADK